MKLKVERACFRALGMSILLLTAGAVQGAVLWNNGATSFAAPTVCDGPCGTLAGPVFTVFDNFTVGASNWFVNGFAYSDFFVNSTTSQYTSTLWSIWTGDPLAGGTVLASGTAIASLGTPDCTLGPKNCLVKLTVSGLSVTLHAGTTYYIGTASLETGGAITQRALSAGNGLPGYESSNGNGNGLDSTLAPTVGSTWGGATSNLIFPTGDTSFDIDGAVLPEPGTLTFMGLTLAGLWLVRRRFCLTATT